MAADEDDILFGSIISLLVDEFSKQADAALVEGVASLPLMTTNDDGEDDLNRSNNTNDDTRQSRRDQKMLRLLRASYNKYIRLVGRYGEEHIFTVAKRTAHFRKRIVQALQEETEAETDTTQDQAIPKVSESDDDSSKKGDENAASIPQSESATIKVSMPQDVNDIPSHEAMAALDGEIETLRTELALAREQRKEEEPVVKKLEKQAQFARESNEVIDRKGSRLLQQLPEKTHAMVKGRQDLQESQKQGTILLKAMDDVKKERADNAENELPSSQHHYDRHNNGNPPRKRQKTLEEQFMEDCARLDGTSLQDLADVKQILRRKV